MLEWYMTHYWMTFWIVIILIYVIDNIIVNLCRVINNRNKLKYGLDKKDE